MTKRRSKITKLPKEIQDQLNNMLDEGATYQSIADWLLAQGFPDFTVENIFHWKEGGFQDWLHHQQRTERVNALMQWGADLITHNPALNPATAIVLFGSSQLQGLLDEIALLEAKGSFAEHPENYAKCFNALARFARIAFDIQKHHDLLKLEAEKLKQQPEKAALPPGKALSEESLDKIEQRLKLM